MKNNIIYCQKDHNYECVYYQKALYSYPVHTHASHVIFGYVLDGAVCITCNGERRFYHPGECYFIMPDMPHAVEPVEDTAYSMVSVSVPADQVLCEEENEITCLKKFIFKELGNSFLIEDMAQRMGISPYHMIRQFKAAFGLTPHQFLIQCRVRRAQQLLGEGKSVIEAAYATGFCDQSHFDRCFRRIVRLTPSEYKQSVRRFFS